MAQDLSHYEPFDDGVHFVLYSEEGRALRGRLPRHFEAHLPFSPDEVEVFERGKEDFLYYDVKVNEGLWLRAISPQKALDKVFLVLFVTLLLLGPLMLILIVLGGYLILKRALKPIDTMVTTANEIKSSKDLSKRIPIAETDDEMHRLGMILNEMLEELEMNYNREKQFSDDVSHELRTPVSVILAEASYALDYSSKPTELKEALSSIKHQSLRMKDLINQILDLARLGSADSSHFEVLDFSSLVRGVGQSFVPQYEDRDINFIQDIEEGLKVKGDRLLLERVVDNLLSNATKFTKNRVTLKLEKRESKALLSIEDNGAGLSKEAMNLIWDRFYQVDPSRNKTASEGLGLGLSYVKKIVELHEAKITVDSKLNEKTTFVLSLDLA